MKAVAIGLGVVCTGLAAAVALLVRRHRQDDETLNTLAAAHVELLERHQQLRAAIAVAQRSWGKA